MSGGSQGDFLRGFPQASSGSAAENPQAHPMSQAMAPWMQQNLGQMGGQLLQAGQRAPMQPPAFHRGPMGPGPGPMAMPPPTMQAQPITPETINHSLAPQTGLMGPQWQMPTIMRR